MNDFGAQLEVSAHSCFSKGQKSVCDMERMVCTSLFPFPPLPLLLPYLCAAAASSAVCCCCCLFVAAAACFRSGTCSCSCSCCLTVRRFQPCGSFVEELVVVRVSSFAGALLVGSDAGTAGQVGGGAQPLDLPHWQHCCNPAHVQVDFCSELKQTPSLGFFPFAIGAQHCYDPVTCWPASLYKDHAS